MNEPARNIANLESVELFTAVFFVEKERERKSDREKRGASILQARARAWIDRRIAIVGKLLDPIKVFP